MVIKKSIFFESDFQDQEKLLREWRSFKFELIELRKKWLHFKDQVIENKLKLKYTATEWVLCQVLGQLQEEFIHLVAISKTALVAPVSNAWPECGGSTIKCIKARSRSQMKNDMLEALMMISLNGPTPNSELADKLIRKVAVRFESSRQYKRPTATRIYFQQNHLLLCLYKRMTSCALKV
jgi:ribosomal protein L14